MKVKFNIVQIAILIALGLGVFFVYQKVMENKLLNKIIERLTADSRIAEVVVTKVAKDPVTQQERTTIKFVEYDTKMQPLPPRSFTFSSNLIQFQSMVIRFDDLYVKKGHPLKGKSAYLFLKAFILKDNSAEVYDINKVSEVPSGYQVTDRGSNFEKKLWMKFWQYALDPKEAKNCGIKNAQIEAPGTKFVLGMLYTIKIEHHGGMRVDAQPIPAIFQEKTE